MKTRHFVLSALLFVCVASARGDILDTKTQDENRYGEPLKILTPIKPATTAAAYRGPGGIKVTVQYIGGRSVYKVFERENGHITPEELRSILNAHSNSLNVWKEVAPGPKARLKIAGVGRHWLRPSDQAEAYAQVGPVKGAPGGLIKRVTIAAKAWFEGAAAKF